MGETRDRGVLASAECIQELKEAQARQRNAEGKVWTQTDIAIESGVDDKTVSRFLNRTRVDEKSAIAICQTLGVKFDAESNPQDTKIESDRTGQLSMNPFIYGDPVPPEKFYGRRQAILEVKNRIGAIASQSVNIVGLRRMGKTSLLRYIRSNPTEFIQAERQPLIVSLDLQSNPVSTPAGIVEGLRRGIIMRQQGKEPWKQDENDDDWAVQDGLEALRDRGVRLIVMLDEFEAIASRLEQFQGWGEDWRSKASTQGLFSLVVASKRPISEMYQGLGLTSPFGNIFSTTILGGLEREAWQKLVRDGFAGSKVSAETLDWIDELAGGLPLYVQMAAALLWQESGDLMRAEAAFRMQAEPRLRELWQGLSEAEQGVVRQLGDGDRAVVEQLQRFGVIRADGRLFSRVFAELVRGQK
jgi:transcriptional regulator with XRE-family HTH domain